MSRTSTVTIAAYVNTVPENRDHHTIVLYRRTKDPEGNTVGAESIPLTVTDITAIVGALNE